MTCIVGVKDKNGVWIGGDRAEASDSEITIAKYPKVFRSGELLIGWSGWIHPAHLLEHVWSPPEQANSQQDFPFIATVVTQDMKRFLEEHKCVKVTDSGPECSGTALIGYRGRLFVLQKDFSVLEATSGYAAQGTYLVALGSLHTTNLYEIVPEERVRMALEAVAHVSPFVCGPFDIEKL